MRPGSALYAGAILFALATPPLHAEEAPARPAIDIEFLLADINDNSLRWSLGREHQLKVPYALVTLSGDAGAHVSYFVELNGLNDSVKPEPFTPSEKTPFYFPNQADPEFGVTSVPEGQFKVDDYKNTGWDPYIQEQHLRRAYVDVHTASKRFGAVIGRILVPMGLPIDEARWYTSKDLTHIQQIDTQVDAGFEGYFAFGSEKSTRGRLSVAGISGNGNPYHDYAYFDFTRSAFEDTNSAIGTVASGRVWTTFGLDAGAAGEYNFVGSQIIGSTTVQRSKHYDSRLTFTARYRPRFFQHLVVFGELARYKWGLRDTSALLLEGARVTSPVYKDGFYAGADLSYPLPKKLGTVGIVVTREELDRDDALVAYLAANHQLGVVEGDKERGTIVKLYADLGPISLYYFHNALDNPFPQVSAIVPISGPFAGQGPGSAKSGGGVRFRRRF